MLRRICLVSLIVVFLGIGVVEAEEKNLVKNPSFEEVDGRGRAIGWNPSKRVEKEYLDKVKMYLSEDAHSGKYSAYIKRTLTEEKPRKSGWYQHFKLMPASTYKASCWVKTKDVAGLSVVVLYIGGWGKDVYLTKVRGDSEWKYYEFTFHTPKNVGKCFIYPVFCCGQGEVWVDDVKVVCELSVKEKIEAIALEWPKYKDCLKVSKESSLYAEAKLLLERWEWILELTKNPENVSNEEWTIGYSMSSPLLKESEDFKAKSLMEDI